MAGSINVTPQMMISTSQAVDTKIEEWQQAVKRIYDLQKEMDAMWDGVANDAFNIAFQEDVVKYNNLAQMMADYSNAIKQAADSYVSGEEEVKGIVGRGH